MTTTPAPAAAVPSSTAATLKNIDAAVSTAEGFLPLIETFIPSIKTFVPYLSILTVGLQTVEGIVAGGGASKETALQQVGDAMIAIGTTLKQGTL